MIDYSTSAATTASTVTLNSVTISGAAAAGVSINNGGFDISLVDSGANSIDTTANAVANDGVLMTGGGGNVSVNLAHTTISSNANGIDLLNNGNATTFVQTANGTISGTAAGVLALSSGTGLVQVINTNTNITAGTNAISAQSGGDVVIDSFGNSTLSGSHDGIYANSAGGNIFVGFNFPIFGTISSATNDGIETVNTSGATGIFNSADMSGLSSAVLGINASSTTGGILVQNYGQIGNLGAGNGVNTAGISANSTGNNTAGIEVDNYANIFVDSGNGTFGITATNAGIGIVTVNNFGGTIGAPSIGINALGGAVIVNNLGVVNATNIGIDAVAGGTAFVANDGVVNGTTVGIGATSLVAGSVTVLENYITLTANGTTTYLHPVVTASAGAGILAVGTVGDVLVSGLGRDLAGNGYGNISADDGLAGNVTTTGGSGITALTGSGNVTVRLVGFDAGNGTSLGSAAGTVAVNSANLMYGIGAQSLSGGNVSIDAAASALPVPTVQVNATATGANNIGILGVANTGDVSILIHANDGISVGGDNSIGVLATSGMGNASNPSGNVTVIIGSGGIVVTPNASGANEDAHPPLTPPGSSGIAAQITGSSGNLSVQNFGAISVTNNPAAAAYGIYATNSGNGTLVVDTSANITANGGSGAGIYAAGQAGVAVGVDASTLVVGNVTSYAGPNISVTGGASIVATSAGGSVLVSGHGRDLIGNGTSGDDGLIGNVTTTGGSGILASTSGGGNITVRLTGSNVGNASNLASPGGTVVVNGADGLYGIRATTTGSGNVTVDALSNANAATTVTMNALASGNVTTGANNVAVFGQTGTGTVGIVTNANDSIAVNGDNSVGIFGTSASGSVAIAAGSGGIVVTPNTSAANENASSYPGSAGIEVTLTGGAGSADVSNSGPISVANNPAGAGYGIYSSHAGSGSINVTNNAIIAVNNSSGAAIYAQGGSGVVVISNVAPNITSLAGGIFAQSAGSVGIDSYSGSNITSTGDSIYARSTGGAVKVGNTHGFVVGNISSAGGNGIVAIANTGSAEIDNAAKITAGAAGISATGGNATTVLNQGVINATNAGISAVSTVAGDVEVMENLAAVVSGNVTNYVVPNVAVTAGQGIVATATAGNVTVSGRGRDGNLGTADDGVAASITTTGGSGIVATTGGGNVRVVLAGAIAASVTGNGTLSATPAGTVSVSGANGMTGIGGQTLANGNIDILIVDNTSATPSVTMTALASGNVTTGANKVGVSGKSTTGNVSIGVGQMDVISVNGDNSAGIVGSSVSGNVTIGLSSGGIFVTPNTSAGNEAGLTTGSSGIMAQITGAAGSLSVVNTGTISVTNNAGGGAYGIYATNSGSGTVGIIANANITANNATGAAIYAAGGTGAVAVTVANNVTLSSIGSATSPSVLMSSATVGNVSGAMTLNNNGFIQSIGTQTVDLAIAANVAGSGPITINNSGRIIGRVDLSGASASTFNNTSSLSWHTSGASTFSGGNDILNNAFAARMATSAATTFAFSNGTDTINNGGKLIVGELAGPSSLTITKGSGTLTLTNSGTIFLGSANGTTSDGETNDQILAQGAGMAFVSSGTSRVVLDANLGASLAGQGACTTSAAFADCITIGASSGTGTRVTLNDTNLAGTGAINLQGTVIIDATSGSPGDFVLSSLDSNVTDTPQGPAIVKGFVQYELLFDPVNSNWDLVGLPTLETFELSKLATGLQSLWYETAGSWNERNGLLRTELAGNAMRRGFALWGKAYGGWINRDSTNTLNVVNTTVSFDTSYWQNYYGIQIGGDYLIRNGTGAFVVGILGGYNRSDVDFDHSIDGMHITVYNAGGYASYMSGPIFADVLVKDDFARVNPDFPAFSGLTHPSANSVGGEFTVGARFTGPAGLLIEPMGTAAYVSTTVEAISWPGMDFNWQNGTSFRGTLAVKLSGTFVQGQSAVEPFLIAGFGDEFKGDNQLVLTSGGSTFTIADKPIDTFATASFGVNLSGTGGLSGYVRGDGLFGNDYKSGAIRAGVRQQF